MTLTADYVRSLFDYDPATGTLRWRGRKRDGARAGSLSSDGYRYIKIDGKIYLEHRVIWLIEKGEWPEGDLDHRDRVKSNNRIGNLRPTIEAANAMNTGLYASNTSGVRGVSWIKAKGKFMAHIKVAGRLRYLGYFDALEDAAAARRSAEAQILGKPSEFNDLTALDSRYPKCQIADN